MNKSLTICSLQALLCIAFTLPVPNAGAQGNAHNNPAAPGEQVTSIVEIGIVNASNYDVAITLLETVRGKEAMDRLQVVSTDNQPPEAGYEYLLARIRFNLQGRSVSDQGTFELGNSPFQWIAYASDFRQYESVSVAPPEPELRGLVQPGETVEGWVAFAVEQSERKPILTFDPASGGATGRGNILFFKLYD